MDRQHQPHQSTKEVANRQTETYLSRKEILTRYSIGNTTLYRWMDDAEVKFPKPIQLGPRMVRWKLSELESWEQQRQTQAA